MISFYNLQKLVSIEDNYTLYCSMNSALKFIAIHNFLLIVSKKADVIQWIRYFLSMLSLLVIKPEKFIQLTSRS